MSTVSSIGGRPYKSLYTFNIGSASIPVAVPDDAKTPKRRRNRRRSRRRRNVSVSSNYDDSGSHTSGKTNRHRSGSVEKAYRSRVESFGAQSNISRATNDTYSRRGSFVSQDYSNYRQYNGNRQQNLRWDRDRVKWNWIFFRNSDSCVFEQMSRQIWRFYENHRQTSELQTKKSHLKEALQKILTNNLPDYSKYQFKELNSSQ